MLDTLRNKQIREVLDIWSDIGRQTFDREKKQVAEMQESIEPRKTRDVDVEVSVEKQVESLNKLLEEKLINLESVLTKRSIAQFNEAVSVADFIGAYNSFVRLYKTPTLSRTSQELAKVKIQEIKSGLDAVIYGLSQLIEKMFNLGGSIINKDIIPLLEANAVYRVARSQLNSNIYAFIDTGAIDVEYKQLLAEQSPIRRAELSNILGRDKDISSQVIRAPKQFNSVDRANRLKEYKDLYDVDFPEEFAQETSDKDFNRLLAEQGNYESIRKEINELKENNEQLNKELSDLLLNKTKIRATINNVTRKMNSLAEELIRVEEEESKENEEYKDDLYWKIVDEEIKIKDLKAQYAQISNIVDSKKAERASTYFRIKGLEQKFVQPEAKLLKVKKTNVLENLTIDQLKERILNADRSLEEDELEDYNRDELISKVQELEQEAEEVGRGKRSKPMKIRTFGSLMKHEKEISSSEDEEEDDMFMYKRPALMFDQRRNNMYAD